MVEPSTGIAFFRSAARQVARYGRARGYRTLSNADDHRIDLFERDDAVFTVTVECGEGWRVIELLAVIVPSVSAANQIQVNAAIVDTCNAEVEPKHGQDLVEVRDGALVMVRTLGGRDERQARARYNLQVHLAEFDSAACMARKLITESICKQFATKTN